MYSPSPPVSSDRADAFSHLQPDQIPGPPRKKMRKGTKSCLECRRRKIKCTFETNRPAICNECYARGSTCIDQEHGEIQPPPTTTTATAAAAEQSYSLRERVTQLEGMVREVLNRLPEGQSSQGSSPAPGTHVDTHAGKHCP